MQNNLRSLRKRRGYTLKTLSEITGLSIGTIGNFETGERGIGQDALEKVASALSVTVADILHEGSAKNTPLPLEEARHAVCQLCASREKEIADLRAELREARSVIRDQASALACALASKPTPAADLACGAQGGGARHKTA